MKTAETNAGKHYYKEALFSKMTENHAILSIGQLIYHGNFSILARTIKPYTHKKKVKRPHIAV